MLYKLEFCVVVDKFSRRFNIHIAKGGSDSLVSIFMRLFQDVGAVHVVRKVTNELKLSCVKFKIIPH